MIHKIQLYILSLWLLFLLIALKEFAFIKWDDCLTVQANLIIQLRGNYLSYASIFFLLLGFYYYRRFKYIIKGSTKIPKQIKKIENQNYEHLTFLTTYIIPFICFELIEFRNVLILVILLIIIGAIYVKTHLFYANPTLALLGYHLYKVNTLEMEGLIFISRDILKEGDKVHHLHLSDNIFYVKL